MDSFNRHFGLIIAYLLPGFVALAGISPLVPNVAAWLHTDQTVTFGAPVYVLLAAAESGMIVSCFRWFLVDRLHAFTGIQGSTFNARALEERTVAFNYLVENHYRYYQFYANTLVAVIWAYSVHCWLAPSATLHVESDVGVLVLCAVIFAGSRDALRKYRDRSVQLLANMESENWNGESMTNGVDHNSGNGGDSREKPSAPPKAAATSAAPAKPQPAQGDKQKKE